MRDMTKTNATRVCVLGAGIVGLATAWTLQRQGHQVTVVDQGQPGMGTSQANGAQLSYSYVQPLADPGIWRQLPKLLLEKDSPLRWQLQADPAQWQWLLQFLAACRADNAQRTTGQLLQLAAESRLAFDQMRATEGIDADFNSAGKLVLYPSEAGFAAARAQLGLQRQLGGAPQHALTPAEARAVEPALTHTRESFAGAIHTPSECAADSHQVCMQLTDRLRAGGATLLLDTPVHRLVRKADRVSHAETANGRLEADAFVLALGCGSRALAQPLGLSLPIYPLKGYSFTADVGHSATVAPSVSVTDAGRKVVFARLGHRLRVAGMVELVGDDLAVPARRIEQLQQCARAWWPGMADWTPRHTWAGLRPATPTGLPLLGRHSRGPKNLLLNTGHGALGFTLAFGSAQRVAALLA